jgi:hypothetical protein
MIFQYEGDMGNHKVQGIQARRDGVANRIIDADKLCGCFYAGPISH